MSPLSTFEINTKQNALAPVPNVFVTVIDMHLNQKCYGRVANMARLTPNVH